ncbi:hypothetical protein HMPREF6485_0023 [Segatella buccae ATCC 33574]|uniref:Uncharacterized protein n=1 Tax=Segatella buccae ATCC 33574 TaxID=873513 RepID=E6K338_9BACT|nr:hypothetical protein HMPREF6485_0023 [Segatella buccae ATCC 33574]
MHSNKAGIVKSSLLYLAYTWFLLGLDCGWACAANKVSEAA